MDIKRLSKRFYCTVLACFGVLPFLFPGLAPAAEFEADMIISGASQESEGRLYVKDSMYRMEQLENGQQVIILVDQKRNVTKVLMPSRKIYMQLESTSPKSAMNDPFQGSKKTAALAEKRRAGSETLNGYLCEKYEFFYKDQGKIMTVWNAEDLNWPIKIVQENGPTMELRNINQRFLEASFFQMPQGYTRFDASGADTSRRASVSGQGQANKGPLKVQSGSDAAGDPEKAEKPAGESKGQGQGIEFVLHGEGGDWDQTSTEKSVDPTKDLSIIVTGAAKYRQESRGKISLYRKDTREKVEEVEFLLKKDESKTWKFSSDQSIARINFGIYGKSGIEVRIYQGDESVGLAAEAETGRGNQARSKTALAVKPKGEPLDSFSGMLNKAGKLYSSGKKLEAVQQLKQAVLAIWDEVPLSVQDIRIVEDTRTYITRENNVYAAGEKVHITAQVFGYKLKKVEGGYSINLKTDLYFMQDGKILAGQQEFGKFAMVSPLPNTEFRLDLTYWFTDAPAGSYAVQTVVHDQNSGQSTKFTTPIELQ